MRAAGMCTSKTEQCVRICCVLRTTTLAVDSKFFSAFLTWPTSVPTRPIILNGCLFMILGADRATFGINDDELRGYMLSFAVQCLALRSRQIVDNMCQGSRCLANTLSGFTTNRARCSELGMYSYYKKQTSVLCFPSPTTGVLNKHTRMSVGSSVKAEFTIFLQPEQLVPGLSNCARGRASVLVHCARLNHSHRRGHVSLVCFSCMVHDCRIIQLHNTCVTCHFGSTKLQKYGIETTSNLRVIIVHHRSTQNQTIAVMTCLFRDHSCSPATSGVQRETDFFHQSLHSSLLN